MTPRVRAKPRRLFRPQWTLSIGAALAAIGFVGAAQWNSSLVQEEFVSSAQRVLVSRAQELQRDQERLRSDLAEREAELQAVQERDIGSQAEFTGLLGRLSDARVAAGAAEVRGPGVVVEIADSLRPHAPTESQNYIVTVYDLRDIVTALWGSGAEAITVRGSLTEGAPYERLVATSAIVGSGNAILVNGAAMSPPYRIEAIGPDGLQGRFLAHPIYLVRVLPRVDAFGLQFETQAQGELTLGAFIGNTGMRWGAPVQEPS